MICIHFEAKHVAPVYYGGLFGGEPGVYMIARNGIETIECHAGDLDETVQAIRARGCRIHQVEDICTE